MFQFHIRNKIRQLATDSWRYYYWPGLIILQSGTVQKSWYSLVMLCFLQTYSFAALVPLWIRPDCVSPSADHVNITGTLSWDHHRNSSFSHFLPHSVNSYCNASVLVRVGWVTPVTCYLLVPKWCVLRWTSGSRKIQLTQLWEETWKLSIDLTKCSLKWLIKLVNCFTQPEVTYLSSNLLFHNICWLFSVRLEMSGIHFIAYLELEYPWFSLSVIYQWWKIFCNCSYEYL